MKSSKKDLTDNKRIKVPGITGSPLVKKAFYLILILLVTLLVYTPARNAKLTNWDDDRYITNNIDITSFKKYKSNLLTKPYEGNYHPLTMLSFAYDYSKGKLNPKVYHRTNIILHLINCVLVFWLIILLTGNLEIGLICGLLFGVHPLHVESVAWVSERKDVLYTLFFLSSLIAYIKYLKKDKPKFYFLALLLFVFSLLSKGMAVSLTITLIAIDYLYDRPLLSKKVLLEKIPFLAMSISFGLIAVYVQQLNPVSSASLKNPFYERLLYATYNIGQYIYKLLIPLKLAVFYPYPEKENGILPLQYYVIPLLIITFMTAIFILLLKSKKPYSKLILFSFFFFLINIALVLQLLPVGNAIMADRYSYIPSIAFFLLIGVAYKYIIENKPQFRNIFTAVMIAYTGWLSYVAYNRCGVWHDSFKLWTDEIEKYPHLDVAYQCLGKAKYMSGDYKGAIQDYSMCIKLNPLNSDGFLSKGLAEYALNEYQNAINDFTKTIELVPNYVDAYSNRGLAKSLLKDTLGALNDYNTAIQIDPAFHQAYYNRAVVKFTMRLNNEGCLDLQKAAEYGHPTAEQDFDMYCK